MAAIALIGLPTAAQPAATAATGSTYDLPAPADTKLIVTQGQNTPSDHNAANGSQYAWDFGIAGNGEFDVTAVRAGKVIGLRDNSHANCYSGGADMSCWKDANYALVDHGDGTSALYMHLAYGSAAAAGVKVGDTVVAGQKLAKDDNTGFSSDNHLHFMVEGTPTVPGTPPPGPTTKVTVAWWWTSSQPIAFSDPGVLAQDPDGIPKYGQTLTSGAAAVQTPSPTSTPDLTGTSTRIVIPSLKIDLPVVKLGAAVYPYCGVAMWTPMGKHFVQPGQSGVTYILAHPRPGLFLPLLDASKVDNGNAMIGIEVDVYTSRNWRFTYKVYAVHRHVLNLNGPLAATGTELWLQTGEGPHGTPQKLQIAAKLVGEAPSTQAESQPQAKPIVCGP